jgi:hypothetical protein
LSRSPAPDQYRLEEDAKIHLEADAKDNLRPRPSKRRRHTVEPMKKRLLIGTLITGLVTIALTSWAVQAVRWAVTGGPHRSLRARLAPAS